MLWKPVHGCYRVNELQELRGWPLLAWGCRRVHQLRRWQKFIQLGCDELHELCSRQLFCGRCERLHELRRGHL